MTNCYLQLFLFFSPFPQIITITFNSQAKLSSSSRFSDCKLKFCTLKAIYLNTQGNGPPQEHHLKHFFILFFCHNDHKSIKRLFFLDSCPQSWDLTACLASTTNPGAPAPTCCVFDSSAANGAK